MRPRKIRRTAPQEIAVPAPLAVSAFGSVVLLWAFAVGGACGPGPRGFGPPSGPPGLSALRPPRAVRPPGGSPPLGAFCVLSPPGLPPRTPAPLGHVLRMACRLALCLIYLCPTSPGTGLKALPEAPLPGARFDRSRPPASPISTRYRPASTHTLYHPKQKNTLDVSASR